MSEDEDFFDPIFDYYEDDCWSCGDEGFVYGCSWDWQCDTYDAGEGTCLCTRRCDFCNPAPRNPELDALLSKMLSAPQGDRSPQGGDGEAGSVHESAGPSKTDAPK